MERGGRFSAGFLDIGRLLILTSRQRNKKRKQKFVQTSPLYISISFFCPDSSIIHTSTKKYEQDPLPKIEDLETNHFIVQLVNSSHIQNHASRSAIRLTDFYHKILHNLSTSPFSLFVVTSSVKLYDNVYHHPFNNLSTLFNKPLYLQ